MSRIGLLLSLVGLCAVPKAAAAQAAGVLAELTMLSASTRAMALGDAFVFERRIGFGTARDVDALFYHPAGLRGASGASIGGHRIGPDGRAVSFVAARDLWGGTVAVGLRALSTTAGAAIASGAFSYRMLGIDAGVVAKVVELNGRGVRGSGAALDVGVGRAVGPVYLALSGRNIGRGPELRGERVRLPWTVVGGVATGSEPVGPFDLAGALSLRYGEDEEWVPAAGLEISWWPVQGRTFTGRIGLQREPVESRAGLSLGAAVSGDAVSIEYAYRPGDARGNGHRIGLVWR